MFDWMNAEGLSARQVARRLNERHVLPRKSVTWGNSGVLRILHNEMYAGWHSTKFRVASFSSDGPRAPI
jgi:hypothetical protein